MDKDELIELLQKLPKGTEIYTRSADNAWPTVPRLFKANTGESPMRLFMCYGPGDHLNFPEHYSGAVEYDIQTHKEIKRW